MDRIEPDVRAVECAPPPSQATRPPSDGTCCDVVAAPFQSCSCLPREEQVVYPPRDAGEQWNGFKWPHIVMMVNTTSGASRGRLVLRQLQGAEGVTAADLVSESPAALDATLDAALSQHLRQGGVRVVAAGGDGTVAWVSSLVARACERGGVLPTAVPLGVLPIGTGNELARNTGWGSYHSGYSLGEFLIAVATGRTFLMDTWAMSTVPAEGSGQATHKQLLCFCSAGFDASIAMKFHSLRSNAWFRSESVVVNKLWHVWYGLEESFSARKYLQRSLKLYVDNQLVEIPDDINLIQLLSVPTGGDGTDYFRTMQDSIPDELQKFTTPSMGDGKIEVVGTKDLSDLLAIRYGWKHARRIAQGRRVQLFFNAKVPFQLDGEPTVLEPCTLSVSLKGKVPVVVGGGRTFGVPPPGLRTN
eukprot:CAMPEP_0114305566 /NCGR_PEP_ID=MMETSP0059-20121206/16412_1 /TAXON_ID=36894 /ORGANISM="Pyramimonas parkeae, Strain CCMP726" /LENGTH=415 /DNA_ID=CAMNT_0001428787 /DNA_START=366 /DNA_END=1613 /DNA_ORIENTATION=+